METQKGETKENTILEENSYYIKKDYSIELELLKIKDIINKLFKKNEKYNNIIKQNIFINKISNMYNFYNKFQKKEFNYCFNNNNLIMKYNIKFKQRINYFNKNIYYSEIEKLQIFKIEEEKNICVLINSLFILRQLIKENNHIHLKNYFKILFFLKYHDIISLDTLQLILDFYINIFIDYILKKTYYLIYIDDLIESFIQFSNKFNQINKNITNNNINNNNSDNIDNIFLIIINLFEEYFINNLDIRVKINKSSIWLNLLGSKIISNFEYYLNNIKGNNLYLDKLFIFLVNIYKFNLNINFLFENIYKNSAIDLNYYLNSINFLSNLFKEEEKTKKDFSNFNIKNGFYIPKNNPLILEKIKFKENEFSLIFSFRIINNDNNKEIIIFNLSNNVNGNIILKFIINKEKTIKIIHGNKEWKIDKIKIENNKDYLVCLTQSYSAYKSTKLLFFINNINTNKKEINKLANKNVIINLNSIKTKKNSTKYNSFDIQSPYPYFNSELVLELGKSNFNGIFGDFIIINKKLNETDIVNLFNLNGYYSLIAENIYDKYDLICKFDNFYTDNKENIIFFKKLNYNCILKLLSNKINNKFIKDKRELKIENYGFLKHKNNQKIRAFDFKYSIEFFYNKNGIEFLLFQLHNISNIIDNNINNNKNDNLNLFNINLYQTLKFFYDLMVNIDDDNTGKKKNDSLKFSYFILSLMIILYKNKKKENTIQLNSQIYDLLLKYIDFYNIHNYYNHRNIIFSILLDDSFFEQSKCLKDGKILIYLMDIIKNNLNNDKNIINKDILYKILNLDFILESKEYHHKLYMKLILSLLLMKNNKIIFEVIIKNIINIKNDVKLYHYMKIIYINFDSLKEHLQNEHKFISFLQNYLNKEINYFHCKYCFNTIFLIYQIKEGLKLDEEKEKEKEKKKEKGKKNKNKNKEKENINNSIKDKDYLFKYKINLIKCKFINCFKMNNDIKFKFIKNYRCSFSSISSCNKKNNENDNKNTLIHIELNLLQYISSSKLLYNFDSIINDIFFIYNIYFENKKDKNDSNNNTDEETEQINNIFETIKFFWEEIINYYKIGKFVEAEHINFLNILLSLRGTETFFRIYLMYDYNSAIFILHQIISLSINRIKYPFYFKYIEIDENIDKNNKINNEKIKKEITEKIIIEIDKINDNEEITIHNRKTLLIIINEIVQNENQLKSDFEKYFIMYLRSLLDKKFFYNKILYKAKGNYYNLLELSLNILFAISKKNNYQKQYNDLIFQFVLTENNRTIFYLIDEALLKNNKNNNIIKNNKKEIDFSNILYCLYFLIYFLEMRSNIEQNEKDEINKDENNPVVFINVIICNIFFNSKEIFKMAINKKNFRNNNSKLNKINLEAYNSLYNFYSLNSKKFFTFEVLEKFYNEMKFSMSKSKSFNYKEIENKNKNVIASSQNKNNFDKTNSQNFSVKKKNDIKIIDNYVDNNEIKSENESNSITPTFHNSISSFSRKPNIKKNSSSSFNKAEKGEKEETRKISNDEKENNEKTEITKKENSEKIETPKTETEIIDNESSSSSDSSEDELNELNNNNKTENIENESKINKEETKAEQTKIEEINKNIKEDNELEIINISKIRSSNELSKNNINNSTIVYSTTNSSLSKSNSVTEDEANNNSIILGINNLSKKANFNIKKLIEELNIPAFYYKQLINYNQLYFTKLIANPKINYIWKIFTYSFKDIIFKEKNFKKIAKCFKIKTRKIKVEISSEEEKKFHLNYPTKLKNFICKDYYRPFLKPDMKFFNRELKISHKYIPVQIIDKIKTENKLFNIKFTKFLPINEKEKDLKRFFCENISYKGSIFGKMFILDSFFVFVNKAYKDIKKNKEKILFFLYSKEDLNKYKNIKKVIIFYYTEIKEIIIRRICLKYIGYEIFLKDGRSYLFNFYNTDEANDFSNCIQSKNKDIKIINEPIYYFEKKDYKTKFKKGEINNFQYLLLINKFSSRTYNNNSQYLVFPIIFMNMKKNILRDLSKAVCLNKEETELELLKYKMNFDIMKCYFNNHYSTSAYVLYYLVRLIPYTYLLIDFQSGKFDVPERIFSNYNNYYTALITSTENRELIPEFYHNYEFCLNLNYNFIGRMQKDKTLINNFNSNKYKNSVAFIINHRRYLDNNVNIVPWINNIFGYNQINDSKELMNIFPLYSYEQFNDFDKQLSLIKEKLKDKENKYLEIYNHMRSKLAILDLGISPAQLFKTAHPEKPNISNNSMIDLNSSIKSNSKNLSLILNNSSNSFTDENSSKRKSEKSEKSEKNEKKDKKKEKKDNEKKINDLILPIKDFISKQKSQKYKLVLSNQSTSLFFIFKNKIIICNILYQSRKIININTNEPQIDYPVILNLKHNLVQLDSPYTSLSKNIVYELMPGFYCISRNENKTLKFINFTGKYIFSYLWLSIITAIEPYSQNITTKNNYTEYKWKLYLGDEEGILSILDTNFKYFVKNNEINMTDIRITKKVKAHKNFINYILYSERLNIVISSSGNGDISINNAFSLETLNFIQIGEYYFVNNIKISFYDLLYVNCYNYYNNTYYLKCYTLNGIKVTKMKTEKKIINFFINDYINIFYEDKTYDKCSLYDFKDKKSYDNYKDKNNKSLNLWENEMPMKEEDDYYSDESSENNEENNSDDMNSKLVHCNYCNKIKKLINIYDNNEMTLEKL